MHLLPFFVFFFKIAVSRMVFRFKIKYQIYHVVAIQWPVIAQLVVVIRYKYVKIYVVQLRR